MIFLRRNGYNNSRAFYFSQRLRVFVESNETYTIIYYFDWEDFLISTIMFIYILIIETLQSDIIIQLFIKMSHIIVFFTSDTCPHCKKAVGDGLIGNGTMYMNPELLRKVVKPSSNANIYLMGINTRTFDGKHQNINRVSLISMNSKGDLFEEVRKSLNNNSYEEIDYVFKNKLSKLDSRKGSGGWSEYLNSKIPQNVFTYCMGYPTYAIFSMDNWLSSTKNNTELIGVPSTGKVVRNSEGEIVRYTGNTREEMQALHSREYNIADMARDATDGRLKFVIEGVEKKPKNKEKESGYKLIMYELKF